MCHENASSEFNKIPFFLLSIWTLRKFLFLLNTWTHQILLFTEVLH